MTGSRCSRPKRLSLRPRSRWSGETPSTRWSWRMPALVRHGLGLRSRPLGSPMLPRCSRSLSVTKPGPFGPRTIELGHYIGIRRQGVLVAMAGERMRLDGFTEISGVCVEPAYRGHGFAADLVGSLASSIAARTEVPFLHVFSSNHAAIALYRKLRFYPPATNASRGARTRGGWVSSGRSRPRAQTRPRTGPADPGLRRDNPFEVCEALAPLVVQLRNLDDAIARLERTIAKLAQRDETARRLVSIPGFGPREAPLSFAAGDRNAFPRSPRRIGRKRGERHDAVTAA